MENERLDDKHEIEVGVWIEKVIKFLDLTVPRSESYSHVNMCLNILFGAHFTIASNFFDTKELQEWFIDQMVKSYRLNFDAKNGGHDVNV